jgi:rhodanese-related sulfurtransferase
MIDDIPAHSAWAALQEDPAARLCDVRTAQEWDCVGVPDLPGGQPVQFVSWKFAPDMRRNPNFVDDLRSAGLAPDHHIYFICRSGARSREAAQAAQAAGYSHVYNVAEGFEGRPGSLGWRDQGLPSK